MNERYKPRRLLSRRPGARTVLLYDEATGRECVGKCVQHTAHPSLHHQHKMEIRVLSALHSERMPGLLDVFEDEEGSWLVETWIEGITLSRWLKKNPSRREKRDVFLQTAACIREVHNAGFAHLDVRSDNLIFRDGRIWLIDFNAAAELGSMTPLMASRKTRLPEEGVSPVTELSDQIGLGTLHAQMFGKSRISARCCRKNPARRFPSLKALENACRPASSSRKAAACMLGLLSMSVPLTSVLQSQEAESPNLIRMTNKEEAGKSGTGKPESGQEQFAAAERSLEEKSRESSRILDALAGSAQKELNWAEEDWLNACALAIELDQPFLASALLPRIPGKILEEHPVESLLLHVKDGREVSAMQAMQAMSRAGQKEQTDIHRVWTIEAIASGLRQKLLVPTAAMAVRFEKLAEKTGEFDQTSALAAVQAVLSFNELDLPCRLPEKLEEILKEFKEGQQLLSVYRRMKYLKEN